MTSSPLPPAACMVFCTCPDEASARLLADTLVAERLAACVNLLPGVTSLFQWQGAVDQASEWLTLSKTTLDRYPQLENRIRQLHPYQLAEIIALPIIAGSHDYLSWIASETQPENCR